MIPARLLVALALLACGGSPTGPGPETLGVLFVGNSLTYFNDLPQMMATMLEGSGTGSIDIRSAARPNYGLQDHWVDDRTRDLIRAGGWDIVVLQQGPSATEGRPSLLDYGARFADEIRSIGGEPAFYMVWPAATRSFDFDGVVESYAMAAEGVGGLLFPAGAAWLEAWALDPSLALYGPDGFHPSALGTYLAALVIFQQLSDVELSALPPEIPLTGGAAPLDSTVARVLIEAATAANAAYRR